jgi:hypothetical protein
MLDLNKCVIRKKERDECPLARAIAEHINERTEDAHKEHQQRMLKIVEHSNVDKDKAAKEAAARICKALKELNK